MSAQFDNVVQTLHSFRPGDYDSKKPWVKVILNPEPPKSQAALRALWCKYSLDFEAPAFLPPMVENALIETILVMLTVLAALRYKKALADMEKEELTELIDSLNVNSIYDAHKELIATLRAEYAYLLENETGVVEV